MSRPDRYNQMFARLRRAGEGAFVPYLTLGDPTPSDSVELARRLVAGEPDREESSGADALELGIPFSDPIADGPAIQASTQRALSSGTTPETALEVAAAIRSDHPDLPLGLLVYSNLVVHNGVDEFFERIADAGFDSVLVADVPALESAPFHHAASQAGLDFVMIVPPNASEATVRTAAERSSGYIYVVTRDGPTGEGRAARSGDTPHLDQLRELGAPPSLVGFGVSEPEHVREALDAGANGAISGSAVARRIEAHPDDRGAMLDAVGAFVTEMKEATVLTDSAPDQDSR